MEEIRAVISQMINISAVDLDRLLADCFTQTYRRKTLLSTPGAVPSEVFFIKKGLIRVVITDREGADHTIHFALENQFIADYSCFIQQQPGLYTLETLEETEVVILPRNSIQWGYQNLPEGNKLGRLIAEFYFIYQDNRIKNLYARTPKERYDSIDEVFPGIHNRVPQHLIASYLGITPVHLSRLKKQGLSKT
jgi:hypothetical protein